MSAPHVWVVFVDTIDTPYIVVYATKADAEKMAREINRRAKAEDDIDTFAVVGRHEVRRLPR